MKTSKRITSLIVALVFTLTSILSFSVFADELTFSDVAETHTYFSAISELVGRGVINGYEDGTFKPEATITRAEFAKLLAVATAPAGTKFEATTTQFPDVADANSSSAWAIPYIAYAVGTKAINGYEDGTFRPTAPVSYGEVIKMIVCTMGYGDVANKNLDPWYKGYVDIANSIGLTKNAYLNGAQPAPRGVVAQLIYNIDFCSKLNNVGFNENKDPIFVQGGSTGGGDWDNSESETGKLLGVGEYSLTGKRLANTEVLIGDTVYEIGKFDVDTLKDMVGYSVSFKFSTMGRKTLTSINKVSGMNSSFTIDDWQIESVSAQAVKYFKNEDDKETDKVSKVTLSENLYVVYNGFPVNPDNIDEDFIEDYLNVENGNITFISNDGSVSSAEMVIVESYVSYFVSSVSKLNGIVSIYDKYSTITGLSKLDFDEHDIASVKRITSKGGSYSDTTIDAISQKAVVSIAQPFGNAEGTNVVISTATVTGSIKEMSYDYEYVKIGNDTFKASPYFKVILQGGADVSFATGDAGKFYLDYQGRIVSFEKTESENPYGLLIRYKHGSGMDATYSVEIYTSAGKLLQAPLKENVRFNGGSISAQTAITRLMNTRSPSANWNLLNDDDEPVNLDNYLIQPIRYKTTVSGGTTYVSEIEAMDASSDYADGLIVPSYPDVENFIDGEAGAKLKYSKSGYSFKQDGSNKFAMGSKTVLFVVPNDITKTESYRKGTYTYSFTDGSQYAVEAYNIDKGNAEVVIYYPTTSNTGATIGASTYTYLINNVTPATYEGSDALKVSYYRADGVEDIMYIEGDYKASEYDYNPSDLKSGDIVKMTSSGKYITNIKPVYVDGELLPDTGASGRYEIDGHYIKMDYSGSKDYYQVMLGVVYQREGANLRVVPAFMEDNDDFNPDAWEGLILSDSVQYYKYNTKENKYVLSSEGEIMAYADMDESAVADSTKVLAIGREKKIVAILIVE